MAGIICNQCGFENPEGSTICEICAEDLSARASLETDVKISEQNQIQNNLISEVEKVKTSSSSNVEYFVICPESHTKTSLDSNQVTKYFCEGCKKEHEIDGFLWNIEVKQVEDKDSIEDNTNTSNARKSLGEKLVLEEMRSHFRMEIDKEGGTLGRYGKYGAHFFQSNHMLMVSGEHCMITNEYGDWVIRHISKTNETKYNNMILGPNEPTILEEGKILTLANAVSFIVRME